MEYNDETAAKIMLAIRPGDSIRRISQKIDASYSWVYDWIERVNSLGRGGPRLLLFPQPCASTPCSASERDEVGRLTRPDPDRRINRTCGWGL